MRHTLLIVALLFILTPGHALAQAFSFSIEFSSGSDVSTLVLGTHVDATNDYDFGVDLLAPPPPFDALYVRSSHNNETYQTDYRDTTQTEKLFNVIFDTAAGGGDIVLKWDAAALAEAGVFEITDNVTGLDFGPFDMTVVDSLSISSAGGTLNEGLRIRMLLVPESGVSNEDIALLPFAHTLEQNFPNPFTSQTEIRFQIAAPDHIRLSVIDILGREVAVLRDTQMQAGNYGVTWEAGVAPAGVYFYKLTSKTASQVRKMMLMR